MWRNSLDYFINQEIEKFNNIPNPNLKQSKSKINELIFAQLIATTNNMLEFDLDISTIEKINNDILNKYEINEDSKKIILMNIIENKKNANKKENNIIIEKNNNNIKVETKIIKEENDIEEENKK